jgi:hypothetical protein
MIRTEEKEMKEDGLDGMAEATTVDLQRPKAAETARGIVERRRSFAGGGNLGAAVKRAACNSGGA